MNINKVKRTLKEGGTAIGTMVFEFSTPGIARLAAEAGAEFIMYDMEHTGWSIETIRDLIATTNPAHIEPLVRVPATHYHFIARVLDVGARGILVPMISDAQQAEPPARSRTTASCRATWSAKETTPTPRAC